MKFKKYVVTIIEDENMSKEWIKETLSEMDVNVENIKEETVDLCEICGHEKADHYVKEVDGKKNLICNKCGKCSEAKT